MKANRLRWAGFFILLPILMTLGYYLIPAHWTSIWMDREFTGWVCPIANQLHGQSRLYADGMHSPMPPLSFILMRLLYPSGAIWINESTLNFIFQAGTLLLLYSAFSKRVGPGLAFAATLVSVPIFFALPKTILYDSMTQFLVAATGIFCARVVRDRPSTTSPRISWLQLAALGLLLSVLALTKQSTGAGTAIGVCAVLLLLPGSLDLRQRLGNVITLVVFTAVGVCLIALVFSSFVSFPGLIRDVFLTGSEVKGGTGLLLANLLNYVTQLVIAMLIIGAVFFFLSWCFKRGVGLRSRIAAFERIFIPSAIAARPTPAEDFRLMLVAFLATVLSFFILCGLMKSKLGISLGGAVGRRHLLLMFFNVGFLASGLLALTVITNRRVGNGGRVLHHPLAPFALIFLPAAIFQNLSVFEFRWTYDNNPLIVLTMILLLNSLATADRAARLFGAKRAPWARLIFLSGCLVAISLVASDQFWLVTRCTQSWPEIAHLSGAKLKPESDGMRKLVGTVRSQVSQAAHETALLLPNDPNVEAWFDRDRPALSCAIVFPDQYWDRYVEKDFAELAAHPPKIIIIGPRKEWRWFCRLYHVNRGTERLIDLVQDKLLPERYNPVVEQPISFEGSRDFMDVYTLRQP